VHIQHPVLAHGKFLDGIVYRKSFFPNLHSARFRKVKIRFARVLFCQNSKVAAAC
jgi:hypothetical protein